MRNPHRFDPHPPAGAPVGSVVLLGILILLAIGSLAAKPVRHAPSTASSPAADPAAIARGRYLVQIGGCNDCHTPRAFDPAIGAPMPDMRRMLSGHPMGAPDPSAKPGPTDSAVIGPTFTSFALPFGTVYAANLTPDPDDGLGAWDESMFVRAMRTGKHMGGNGRAIMPPMPWQALAAMSDPDLHAVFAYLRSIPPVKNAVPAHKVSLEAYDQITAATDAAMKRAAAH